MVKTFSTVILLFLGIVVFAQNQQKLLLKKELQTTPAKISYKDSIEVYGITYTSDSLKVNGYLVQPKTQGPHPVIIFNRGGNRDFGELILPYAYRFLGQLAKEGYVVIASQYRGNGGSEGVEEFGGSDVDDVVNLIDVLAEIKEADTTRIGMYGWSRGGMMTLRALTETNKIKAAVVGGALSDMRAGLERPEMEKVYSELIPNYANNKEAELTKRSAIEWVDKLPTNVPLLMLHGNADWRVKCEQSLKLAIEFGKYRIPYRLVVFEGSDHGINENKNEVNKMVLNWFDRFLKNNEPLPDMKYHGR
ncbi:prolyl oligopeptidase family serine peptidase [Flavobacterium rakeshii]|uniref:Prolyl oligopeptidase family serine peptidase n=1 Tax=Flavobacterium rakeshii TaxID=1038845 RepID=A0A6N8HBW5_9FLAO|nr:prolyl oligopeptidase family serine peptidase [Flavobacterium rakeshii]MEE1898853.1 prolyl oligopeptidase family serine peptidase [Flavobacterium rakeshii]MUV04139.1 prolyl oligopeptidase family serine peptidase [Flavobacterium rakeshii]